MSEDKSDLREALMKLIRAHRDELDTDELRSLLDSDDDSTSSPSTSDAEGPAPKKNESRYEHLNKKATAAKKEYDKNNTEDSEQEESKLEESNAE